MNSERLLRSAEIAMYRYMTDWKTIADIIDEDKSVWYYGPKKYGVYGFAMATSKNSHDWNVANVRRSETMHGRGLIWC